MRGLREHVLRYAADDAELVKPLPRDGEGVVVGLDDFDDGAVLEPLGSRLVVSADGPYAFRLVRKSAVVHAATDVLAMGGEPRYLVDTVIAPDRDGAVEAIRCVAEQARALGLVVLGGNTMIEDDVEEPKVSLTVMGPLVAPEPLRDDAAEPGHEVVLVGEPIHGDTGERMEKARRLFDAFPRVAEAGLVRAAKDVTKGGLVAMAALVCAKSGVGMDLHSVPYPSLTRNWDNILVTVEPGDSEEVVSMCAERGCPACVIGEVVEEPVLRVSGEVLVDEDLMTEIADRIGVLKG